MAPFLFSKSLTMGLIMTIVVGILRLDARRNAGNPVGRARNVSEGISSSIGKHTVLRSRFY
jgi:hypothetical protein